MRQPSVVTEADQLEVDTRISQELQLLDVLDHGPGLLLHKCLHELWRANGQADADHSLHLHDVPGGVVVDSEDVLEAVERLVSFHEALHLLPCLCQGQAFDIDLALGEADVQSCVLLEGNLELRKNVEAIKEG